MIRRRPQNALSSPNHESDTDTTASIYNNNNTTIDGYDNDNASASASASEYYGGKLLRSGLFRRRCECQYECECRWLSSKISSTTLLLIAMFFVLFIIVFAITITADYSDNNNLFINTAADHYQPNNYISSVVGKQNTTSSSNININININDQASKGSTAADNTTGSASASTSSDIIPYVRHEPLAFKAIKARMDYAAQNGDAGDPNNVNNTIGQYLLDVEIIGFPKCGTTTMSKFNELILS